MEAKCGTVRPEEKTLFDDNNSDSKKEDVGETLSKPPPGDYGYSHPAFPTCASLLKPSLKSLAVLGLAEVSCSVLYLFFFFHTILLILIMMKRILGRNGSPQDHKRKQCHNNREEGTGLRLIKVGGDKQF